MSGYTSIEPQVKKSTNIRQNLSYLISPSSSSSSTSNQSSIRFRTRVFLRTFRYVTIFIFWRLIRSLRYALVGSVVAGLTGTLLAPIAGPLSILIAPSGIIAGAGVGIVWSFARFKWKRFLKTVKDGEKFDNNHNSNMNARKDEENDAQDKPITLESKSFDSIKNQFDPSI